MGRAPDVAASGRISRTGVSGPLGRQFRRPDGARYRGESGTADVRETLEPRSGEIHDAAGAQRHRQRADTVGERHRGQRHRVAGHHVHLILVHLYKIEAAAPSARIWKRAEGSRPVRLHCQEQRVDVAVDGTGEMLSNQLRSLEIELEPADQIYVKRVEISQQRLEAETAPTWHASAELLAPALVALVVHHHSVIGMRYFDRSRSGSGSVEASDELSRRLREIAPHLEDRNKLPVRRQRCLERAERVSDAAPFLHGRVAGISPVNYVPDEAPHHPNASVVHHRVSAKVTLKLTERLHLERGDRSDDTGRKRKGTRHDPTRLHRRLEGAAFYFGAKRAEQRVARLRDAARENHDIGIEDIEQVRHSRSEESSRLADDLRRDRISALRSLRYRLLFDFFRIPARHAGENEH